MTDIASQEQKNPDEYPFAVYYTQGGGLVHEVSRSPFVYEFVEAPDECLGLKVGDKMPAEWDLIPANAEANKVVSDEQFGSHAENRAQIADVLARYGGAD